MRSKEKQRQDREKLIKEVAADIDWMKSHVELGEAIRKSYSGAGGRGWQNDRYLNEVSVAPFVDID